ncbi:hypothetical protein SRB5_11860 [Streptomyces sp. RB5]|uniref:Uncharacterized protein n=1 Tax=Streptomyces smaragdinus TaxID=2585196 RepID=A0A7K0CDC4_9ACTN|nr:hypothetical protein [Streptomyces smaragdinus]
MRHCKGVKTAGITRQAVHTINSTTVREASPQFIGRIVGPQHGASSRHYVRDATFAEDAFRIRTGHGPEKMANLCDLAINRLRESDPTSPRRSPPDVPRTFPFRGLLEAAP